MDEYDNYQQQQQQPQPKKTFAPPTNTLNPHHNFAAMQPQSYNTPNQYTANPLSQQQQKQQGFEDEEDTETDEEDRESNKNDMRKKYASVYSVGSMG